MLGVGNSAPSPLADVSPHSSRSGGGRRVAQAGRAPGVCGISPEMLALGGPSIPAALRELFTLVWESEVIPADWHKGIICLSTRQGGPGRLQQLPWHNASVSAGQSLCQGPVGPDETGDRCEKEARAKRIYKERSTLDRVLALNLLAQERREYKQPLYAAYVDLKAAFDSVDRKALYLLLAIIGIPEKLVALFRALCSDACSCVRSETTCSD